MKRVVLSAVALSAAVIFSSCESSQRVTRVSADSVTDIGGTWNDTDVRIVADQIVAGCLASPRIAEYPANHGGKLPVIIVGSYRNKSDEHLDTEIITKKLEAALVNSGKVEFVASSSERDEVRNERNDQQINSSEDTAKSLGNETGADFILQGSVKTIVDTDGKIMSRTYYVTTELINIETNKKIWMDDNSSIKKIIKSSSVRM
ncbi:MAG: penicillin-binding protein activator LpoB [Treponema sp.]|nr:penicillin-binding protein activator LpoB [Treponema sp.]